MEDLNVAAKELTELNVYRAMRDEVREFIKKEALFMQPKLKWTPWEI